MSIATRTKPRKGIRAAIAATLTSLLVIGASFAGINIAQAASGPVTESLGWSEPGPGSFLGARLVNGTQVAYCIEMGIDPAPTFSSGDSLRTTSFNVQSQNNVTGVTRTETVSPDDMMRINYLINVRGSNTANTTDNRNRAAAVQLAIWSIANPTTFNEPHAPAASGLGWYIFRAPVSEHAEITAYYNQFRAEALALTPPSGGSGSATLSITMTNGYNGVVNVVTNPTNATGTLTLTGAVVASTGLTTASVTNGSSIPIIGTPLDTDDFDYEILAEADFTATVSSGWGQNIRLHNTGAAQQIVSGGDPGVSTINFSALTATADPIILFEPVVTTEAPRFVQEGETFTDRLFAGIADPLNPASNPWREYSGGNFTPVNARGTLYGPFNFPPTQSPIVPPGAPVVASDILVTFDQGPGEYATPPLPELTALEAGYYTWVWSIDYADQTPFTQADIPVDYFFQDDFGQAIETSVVPTNLVATTDTVEKIAAPLSEVRDTVTPILSNGAWLTRDGSRIPVTFTGEAYFYPGETQPPLTETVPAEAVLLETVSVTTNSIGTVTSPAITAPLQEGWVVWVWSIRNADQPTQNQGFFREWNDWFGVESELTFIDVPEVTTQATPEVALTDPAIDNAVVNGYVPADSYLTFTAHKAVVAGEQKVDIDGVGIVDGDGAPVLWTQEEIDLLTPEELCVAQPVFDTTGSPVPVTEGFNDFVTYTSPPVTFLSVGTYYWVETLWTIDPDTGSDVALHIGECGIPNETTFVTTPNVVTQATPTVQLGDPSSDTAIVNGLVPTGATLTFAAYREVRVGDEVFDENGDPVTRLILDENGDPLVDEFGDPTGETEQVYWTEDDIAALDSLAICSPATLVFDLTTPIPVTPGLNEDAEYVSEEVVFEEIGSYFWVETLADRDGNALHVGECGIPNETTIVTARITGGGPGLPDTGSADEPLIIFGTSMAVVFLLGLMFAWVASARRRAAAF